MTWMSLVADAVLYIPPVIYLLHQSPGRIGWWLGGIASSSFPLLASYLVWEVNHQWELQCRWSGCSGISDALPGMSIMVALVLTWVWCASWATRFCARTEEEINDRILRCTIGGGLALAPWFWLVAML